MRYKGTLKHYKRTEPNKGFGSLVSGFMGVAMMAGVLGAVLGSLKNAGLLDSTDKKLTRYKKWKQKADMK